MDTHFHVFRAGATVASGARYKPEYDAPLQAWEHLAHPRGVTRGLLVQPSFLGTDNSQLLAALAARPDQLRGVAVIHPTGAADNLPTLHAAGVRGLRWNLVGNNNLAQFRHPDWHKVIDAAHALGWHLELHVEPDRLPEALALLPTPPITVVLDHFGKLGADLGAQARSLTAAQEEARRRDVYVKLSAPYRTPGLDLRAAALAWAALLGPERLLWGSDWPWTNHEEGQDFDALLHTFGQWIGDVVAPAQADRNALALLRWPTRHNPRSPKALPQEHLPMSTPVSLIRRPTLRLNPADDVVIAARPLSAGTRVEDEGITCTDAIPAGHKLAVRAVSKGSPVKRYNQVIGFATHDIAPGQHVHTHNLTFETFERDYAVGSDLRPAPAAPATPATFQGIVRADGRVATRNYIGVVSTVNCSATVSKLVAAHFTPQVLARFPNVDGIVPITHSSGCGMASAGAGIDVLRRTIAGYCRHVNFAGVVIIGLGCEANQMDSLFMAEQMQEGALLKPLIIQTGGGTKKTVAAAVDAIESMLPKANAVTRQQVSASHITIGLQCGGSDGYSGITANPALGAACDLLVAHGGTVILSETPEIYGAEHLLTRRAVSAAVADKLIARIRWWEDYTARNDGSMDNNPSPGNKAGGLTTILEKSLGAVAKGGTTNLVDVYEYAQPVTAKGFVFMDTPGYDPVSATGQVAGGANLICFTTGRGSVYGCKPAPSLKLATNTVLYERMRDDMDINCGDIADGTVSIQDKGREIFEMVLRTASGEASLSESLGMGNDEFVPWQLGAVM